MSEVPFAEPFRWVAGPVGSSPFTFTTANAEEQRTRNNVDWDDANNHVSGILPQSYNVLIDQDPVEEKTKGGLIRIDQEKQKNMASRGTIVAVSPMAFKFEDWPEGYRKPGVGARVAYVQHAGKLIEGQDGKEYRIITDKDVMAVLR